MLEAYNSSSNSATSYIYEPGIDRPLAQVLSNGSIRYVHQDVLGSVVMLTDSNGAAYQSYSYDAWGKVTARDASGSVIASSAISAPWLFTGRRFDKESGLYHYRARTYSAELGRFLQMDPIKFDAGDPNIFRYVGNDPLNWTDPWGLQADGMQSSTYTEQEKIQLQVALQGGQNYCKNNTSGNAILKGATNTAIDVIISTLGLLKGASSAADVFNNAVSKLGDMAKNQAIENVKDRIHNTNSTK